MGELSCSATRPSGLTPTDVLRSPTLEASRESRCGYTMSNVTGGLDFGALLSKVYCGVAWVADEIGGIRR